MLILKSSFIHESQLLSSHSIILLQTGKKKTKKYLTTHIFLEWRQTKLVFLNAVFWIKSLISQCCPDGLVVDGQIVQGTLFDSDIVFKSTLF